jgi:hypothetical protein
MDDRPATHLTEVECVDDEAVSLVLEAGSAAAVLHGHADRP